MKGLPLSRVNPIALRLSGDSKARLSFHGHAIPALLVAAALGYALLFLPHLPHLPRLLYLP